MRYNFDEIIDRSNTGSLKWDFKERYFEEEEIFPMWVADMDFKSPQPVIDVLTEKAQFGIYGYTEETESYRDAVVGWIKQRHNWTIKKEWLHYSPGVVPALHWIVQRYAHPGDKIIIQSPVYYPFFEAIKNGGCQIVNNPLKLIDGKYYMDFEDFENKIDDRVKMIVLCSPHNPGGMVWNRETLCRLGDICINNDILVVSDEIHGDLVLSGSKHIPFAALSEDFAMNSITCYAPSKTFNLAGLQISNIIIPNPRLAKEYKIALGRNEMSRPNLFAVAAAEAAYSGGQQWLEQLISYIEGNHKLVEDYIAKNVPEIKAIQPQASYLAWIDCRNLGMDDQELQKFMEKKAGLALNSGAMFGQGGTGFVRMNLGCPRSVVEKALQQLDHAVHA